MRREEPPVMKPSTYLCDACTGEPPKWRYNVPPGTVFMAVQDTATGRIDQTVIADGVGLCDVCRAVLEAGEEPAERLARRATRINPLLRAQPARVRLRARETLAKVWAALIPKLAPPVPARRGDSPRDGTIEHLPPIVLPPRGGPEAN
jgi:hypothetical protein